MSGNEDEERSPRIFDRRRRQNSLGSTTGPDSEDEGLGYDDYKSFPLSSIQEQDVPSIQQQEESVAQGLSASVSGPGESEEAQNNIEVAEIFTETIEPFCVETLQCYKDGFEYISNTPYKTVLAESENYPDPIMGGLVDRMVCAAIPTFFPTELPNFDPYLASALIKRVLPRLQSFIDGYICDTEGEPEMTEQEMRDMISNIMPLTPVPEANFEQLCSNFLRVRKEAVSAIGKSYSPRNPSMGEIKDFSSASYVYPEVGGKKQTKKYKKMRSRKTKKSRKPYRGGQKWRIYFMGFMVIMFGIGILITLFYTQYELKRIKDQVDVTMQTPLVNKIFEILKMMQKGEAPSNSFTAISYKQGNQTATISSSTAVVSVSDKKEYPLSISSNEKPTFEPDFLEELQENEALFLQLQKFSETGPAGLIYLYMSGGFTFTSFDVLNDMSTRAADFLLKGIETVESAKIKKELVELQKGFADFAEIDENAVLTKFFSECYASEISSSNLEDAFSLLYVAEDYEEYYKLVTKLRIQKLMPKPEVVTRFTRGLVTTLVEQNEKYSMTDQETGLQGNMSPLNPGRRLLEMIPGFSTIAQKFDSMTEKTKHLLVTSQMADEKAACFVRTMQSISKRKFAQLDALKADLKILQMDIGEVIGVEVVKNAFEFILPKGTRLFNCYKVLTCLISLFAASITTYGIYKTQEKQEEKTAAQNVQVNFQGIAVGQATDDIKGLEEELVVVKQKIAKTEAKVKKAATQEISEAQFLKALQQMILEGKMPGFPGQQVPNNSNSNSSSSGLGGVSSLFETNGNPAPVGPVEEAVNRGRTPPKMRNKPPGYGKLGGGRTRRRTRQTKKRRRPIRRRQTRKLRRNTKRRRM